MPITKLTGVAIDKETLMEKASQLVVDVSELISLPDIYLRIRHVIDDPNSSITDLANIISNDPALTGKLLNMANSAFFGFSGKVDTVSRAINLLGTQQLHDLALATIVLAKFSGFSNPVVAMKRYWKSSIYSGVVARLLAKQCNILDCERLFVEGLLRDIGHQIMYVKLPKLAGKAQQMALDENVEVFHTERRLFGYDYAEVGSILMQHWGLPLSLQASVRYHTQPSMAQDFILEASIVHVANLITIANDRQSYIDYWLGRIDPVAKDMIDLDDTDIELLMLEADQNVAETSGLILGENTKAA